MIKQLNISRFTVFESATIQYSPNINIIVGENGTGKTHLLKLPYCILSVSAREGLKSQNENPTKSLLQPLLAGKIINVFRPEVLGHLTKRRQGRERCDISATFNEQCYNIAFSFASNSKSEVNIDSLPKKWIDTPPVYIPTRELLAIYPNFVSIYENHYLELEETWRDTCLLLGALLQRGPKEQRIRTLLQPIEEAMEGSIELDRNGRFYLRITGGRIEMPLVAEGLRKLGMLSRLIATGKLLENGYLFWDEPESNLNPKLVKQVAKTIIELAMQGIQVFIATHSLFLLREFEILMKMKAFSKIKPKFFGLHKRDNSVVVEQGVSVDDIGDITSLDEDLMQSDRYLEIQG